MLDAILLPNKVEQEELGKTAGFIEGDDEVGFACDDAAHWLLAYLGKECPDKFVKACEMLGHPVTQTPMTAEYATTSMRDATGICPNQGALVNS
jgi:hypothetical protein